MFALFFHKEQDAGKKIPQVYFKDNSQVLLLYLVISPTCNQRGYM